ncbi:hypothetical protein TKK_0011158 [Trichogramma kaykai]
MGYRRKRSRSTSKEERDSSTSSCSSKRRRSSNNQSPPKEMIEKANKDSSTAATNNIKAPVNPDFINAIGKRMNEERVFAPDIHPELAARWKEVVEQGLPDKEREEIAKKCNLPKNCEFSDPPEINQEIKTVISQAIIARDDRIAAKQQKIVTGLSVISKMFAILTKDGRDLEDLPVIEGLSDAVKIFADVFRDESIIRRSLIAANINTSLRETITNTKCGKFLFGDRLDETIKSAKAMETAAKDLRMSKKTPSKTHNFSRPKNSSYPRRFKKNHQTSGGYKSQRPQNHRDKKRERDVSYTAGRLKFYVKNWEKERLIQL